MTTVQDTVHSQGRSTYDIYFEIDCDCQELLDAIGLDYTQCEDDDTQNEVALSLTKDEYIEAITDSMWASNDLNEQSISAALLNPELGEYTTKVTIYKPNGDKITFE
jgi:hypothetical protein